MSSDHDHVRLITVTDPDTGATEYAAAICRDVCDWQYGDVIGYDVVLCGPTMGNALLPADVRAGRWAEARGLPYRE